MTYRTLFYLALFFTILSCGSEEIITPDEPMDPLIGIYKNDSANCEGFIEPLNVDMDIEIIAQENPADGYILRGFFTTDLQLAADGSFDAQPHDGFSLVIASLSKEQLLIETQKQDLITFQKCNYVYSK